MSNTRLPASLAVVLVAGLLGSCSALDRPKNIGEQPSLSASAPRPTALETAGGRPSLWAIETRPAQPGYKPVQMPMPAPQPAVYNPNSLWRNGSRAVLKDQAAVQGGAVTLRKGKLN